MEGEDYFIDPRCPDPIFPDHGAEIRTFGIYVVSKGGFGDCGRRFSTGSMECA